MMSGASFEPDREQATHTAGFAERVRANQQTRTVKLKPHHFRRVDCGHCPTLSASSVERSFRAFTIRL
jgi:hypothetical protein